MSASNSPSPGQLTIEAAEWAGAIAHVRMAMAATEQRLRDGHLRQAAGEVGAAIQELMALHGALIEAHIARGQRELGTAQLAAGPWLRGVIHHERLPAQAPQQAFVQEIH